MAKGLFNKEKKELTELEKLKVGINKSPFLGKEQKDYLLKCSPDALNFENEQNYIQFINTIINNKTLCEQPIEKVLEDARTIYTFFESQGYSFREFLILFLPGGIYEKGIFSTEILVNYERIENYYIAMQMLIKHDITLKNFKETIRLISSLGIYTPNDIELNSMLSHFLTTANFAENYSDIVDTSIETAKRRAGVYDDLSDNHLAKMEAIVNKGMAAVETYKQEEQRFNELAEKLKSNRLEAQKVIKSFEERLNKIDEAFNQMASKYQGEIDDAYVKAYVKLGEDFREVSSKIVEKADTEAKKAAIEAVGRLEKSAKNLAELESQYRTKTTNELEGIEKIKKLATDEVNKGLEEIRSLIARLDVDESVDLSKLSELLKAGTASNIVIPSQTIVTPMEGGIVQAESMDEIKIPDVLPYFEDSIDFKNRLKMILDRKAKLESEGEVFNEVIDDCIYFMMRNLYVYLYGPSGAGKNYFVKQLGKLFNLPVSNIGYITEEYDIVGGKTAHGSYSPSNFYNCWRNGYLGFANELDNSVAQAAIKLGDFLDAQPGEEYCFPGLRFVKKHPNCRIIAAGNTTGMGSNRAYNARQKFDESLQQRFKFVKFDFDPKVEEEILKNHQDWYEFAKLFRVALDNYWIGKEGAVEGQITTRDLRDIRTEIEDGILTPEKILQYEFIETKEPDCLGNVLTYMQKHSENMDRNTKKLMKTFEKIVNSAGQGA